MGEGAFTYVWSYRVPRENTAEFIRLYGRGGTWVALFERGEGYIDTSLYRDSRNAERFITVDRWVSEESYSRFRQKFAEEFEQLDRQGGDLTVEEAFLGNLEEVGTTD